MPRQALQSNIPWARETFPLMGILPYLWRSPAERLISLYERYGPVFRTKIPGQRVHIAIGPEANEKVLRATETVASAHDGNGQFTWLFGEPIETLDGSSHRRLRNLLSPLFSGAGLEHITSNMAQVIRGTVAEWQSLPIVEATRLLSLHVILRAVIGAAATDLKELERLYNTFTCAFFAPKIALPYTHYTRGLEARERIDRWLLEHIASMTNHPSSQDNILGLIVSRSSGEKAVLSQQEVLDNVRIMVFAGQETTASVLAWTLIHLALDNDLWNHLCKEVPRSTELPLTFSQVGQFTFIRRLLNESLRRYTPAWFVPRGIRADNLVIGGHAVPKGTMIAVSPLATQHLSQYWPKPFQYDVDRWNSDFAPQANTFLPFGIGPHTCLGTMFATIEMTQLLVALAASRRRPVLSGHYDLRPLLLALPHPSRKIRMRFVNEA